MGLSKGISQTFIHNKNKHENLKRNYFVFCNNLNTITFMAAIWFKTFPLSRFPILSSPLKLCIHDIGSYLKLLIYPLKFKLKGGFIEGGFHYKDPSGFAQNGCGNPDLF